MTQQQLRMGKVSVEACQLLSRAELVEKWYQELYRGNTLSCIKMCLRSSHYGWERRGRGSISLLRRKTVGKLGVGGSRDGSGGERSLRSLRGGCKVYNLHSNEKDPHRED